MKIKATKTKVEAWDPGATTPFARVTCRDAAAQCRLLLERPENCDPAFTLEEWRRFAAAIEAMITQTEIAEGTKKAARKAKRK